jgi:phage terminase large subunit-like protein
MDLYTRDILSGEVPSCQLTQLAVKRHLRDLERSKDQAFPYMFDPEAATKVCNFVELCPHVKGKLKDQLIRLEPWQCWDIAVPFGWVEKETGLRRFREWYSEIAKGNGKSPISAALALYMAFFDGEPGAEVYCAAWSALQARYVFDPARQMISSDAMAAARKKFGIEVGAYNIFQRSTNSFMRCLTREANLVEGSLPYFVVVDELHVHQKRTVLDNVEGSTNKRDGSMVWIITTAGSDHQSICYEKHEKLQHILEGSDENEEFGGIIFGIDKEDDRYVESTWRKANPNWGVSVNPKTFRQEAMSAKKNISEQTKFFVKKLNIWTQAEGNWMDMPRFLACADKKLKEEDFNHLPCVPGVDWASKNDLAAIVRLYFRTIENKVHYYAFSTAWCPREMLWDGAPNADDYRKWEKMKCLVVTPGAEVDDRYGEEFLEELCATRDVREIAYDPWGLKRVMADLIKRGKHCVEINQITKELSPAMKELDVAVKDGRFHYDGNPVLTWCVNNIYNTPDNNDNWFPRKASKMSSKKIDVASALLNAINRAMVLAQRGIGKPARRKIVLV